MDWLHRTYSFVVVYIWICSNYVLQVDGGETCGAGANEQYCEHGCCDNNSNDKCCSISTSVLVVACAVGGVVFLALVTSVAIICYKNYQEKRATRVRRLQQQEAMNSPRVRGVEPLKPPDYVSSPPEYSAEMPESHYRPVTVNANISYNQRFRGMTPLPGRSNIATTETSRRYPMVQSHSGNTQIPGSIQGEAPPPYSEFARGRTPANRRQMIIHVTTPIQEETDNTDSRHVNTSLPAQTSNTSSNILTTSTIVTANNRRTQAQSQNQASMSPISSISSVSSVAETRLDTDTPTSRRIESREETRQDLLSRSQTVARILGARTPRGQNLHSSVVTPSSLTVGQTRRGGGPDLNRRGLISNINTSVPGSTQHERVSRNSMVENLTTV